MKIPKYPVYFRLKDRNEPWRLWAKYQTKAKAQEAYDLLIHRSLEYKNTPVEFKIDE